jgi:hypothetical protein
MISDLAQDDLSPSTPRRRVLRRPNQRSSRRPKVRQSTMASSFLMTLPWMVVPLERSDFEAEPCETGDAFVIAPDGSRRFGLGSFEPVVFPRSHARRNGQAGRRLPPPNE